MGTILSIFSAISGVNSTVSLVTAVRKALSEKKIESSVTILTGELKGQVMNIKGSETVRLGKDPSIAHIVFPSSYQQVSRLHCHVTFNPKSNKYYITDCSSNGTYMQNHVRLIKGSRMSVAPNTVLELANDDCLIYLS